MQVWPASCPNLMGPMTCQGKFGPLEGLAWAWALSYPGWSLLVELLKGQRQGKDFWIGGSRRSHVACSR
ncbi:unnamed protein product [Prunus brigantina]